MPWAKPLKRNHGSTTRFDCEYTSVSQHKELDAAWQSIGASINKMIERSDGFCKNAA